jgi:hypothetical protein
LTLTAFETKAGDEAVFYARENLWRMQERLSCYPDVDIAIVGHCAFNLAEPGMLKRGLRKESRLKCYMSTRHFGQLLRREAHWNNLELGGWIEFDRRGAYNPDVHTLLSFFHLPRGQH